MEMGSEANRIESEYVHHSSGLTMHNKSQRRKKFPKETDAETMHRRREKKERGNKRETRVLVSHFLHRPTTP